MHRKTVPKFLLFAILLIIGAQSLNAQSWSRIGPPGGNVISLVAAPPNHLFAGLSDGHIYVSDNGGKHWELRGRVDSRTDAVVQKLIVDSRLPQRLFAAVWYQDPALGGALFRSEDSGHTWAPSGITKEAVRVIEQSPSSPNTFLAGTRNGVFRSTDNGLSWERITPSGDAELRNIDSLAFDPRNPQIIYVGTYHLPWKTTDGGKNWAAIHAGMIDDSDVMSLRVDASQPERIFASACSGIYRSDNGGGQWIKLQGIPYTSRRTQVIVQDPVDAAVLYAGTTEGLWATRDSGETWKRISPREWVINGVSFVNRDDSGPARRLVLGTESQGILVSDDAGKSFVAANKGLSHFVVADLAGDPTNTNHLLARIPGLAEVLQETYDAGKTWLPLAGDTPSSIRRIQATEIGWFALLDSGGGLAQYDATAKNWINWKFILPEIVRTKRGAKAPSRSRRAVKPTKTQVFDLRFSAGKVFVATEQGLWSGSPAKRILTPMAQKSVVGKVLSIDISRDGNEFWLVSAVGIFHSLDGGAGWSQTPFGEQGSPQWIRFFLSDSKTLLAGTTKGAFVSLDAGNTWTLLQSGLPATDSYPALTLQDTVVIALKSGGLYLSPDRGRNWTRLDGKAEAGIFTDLLADYQGGIYVGSRTEGVLHWKDRTSE